MNFIKHFIIFMNRFCILASPLIGRQMLGGCFNGVEAAAAHPFSSVCLGKTTVVNTQLLFCVIISALVASLAAQT